jgi:predicted O-methyltransferase YrrM
MEIVHPAIETYLEEAASPSDPILREMEEIARRRHFPIVGPLVGRLLCQLAMMIQAERILELGSGFGYSAYWFAKGLKPHGKIFCTEGSKENAAQAVSFFKKAGQEKMMAIEVGEALEMMERYSGPFDIIFMDIDKEQYPMGFEKTLPKLRRGGLFVVDNMLWFGSVLSNATDPDILGIKRLTERLYASKELWTTILPLRDGVSISLKL